MTTIDVIKMFSQYGITSVILAALLIAIGYNYKSIINWLLATIQAAAIVKSDEETIQELKREIESLRQKLEEYNVLLMRQSETIARLEERIIVNAKRKVNRKVSEN